MMKLFFKRLFQTLSVLVGLLIVFHLVENWRGSRALVRWRTQSNVMEDPKDLEELAPPKIPDEDNFAAHPLVAAAVAGRNQGGPVEPALLPDSSIYRTWEEGRSVDLDALKASLKVSDLDSILEPFTQQLQELERASLRPHCRLLSRYDFEQIPALLGMRKLARMLSLRAVVSLRKGQPEAAMADVLTILRVANHLKKEPHLISHLLRVAYVKIAFQPIWEGLHGHQWTENQLARLQEALAGVDLLESWKRPWEAEALFTQHNMHSLAAAPFWPRPRIFGDAATGRGRLTDYLFYFFFPKGWILQNFIRVDMHHQRLFRDVVDPVHQRVDARGSDREAGRWSQTPRSPYTMLAKLYAIDFSVQNARFAHAQATVDEATTACALERYRLVYKAYPERLESLIPAWMGKPPVDLFDGNALRYQGKGKDSYLLYSLGWNGTDEGGKRGDKDLNGGPRLTGDWVWMGIDLDAAK